MTVSTQLARADHLALEARAAGALAGHDFAAAFRWADRRCRMSPPPEAHAYVLRAESLVEALAIVHRDPAHTSGGWEITVHEWRVS